MSYFSEVNVKFADSGSIDAFSRVRVSNPVNIYTSQSQYDHNPLKNEIGATGTGVTPVHSANDRMVKLSATAGSGTSFIQSKRYHPYQAGKSHQILLTGVIDTAVAGAVKDFGYFDAANGIFFRQNGTSGLEIVRRTSTSGSVVDHVVTQATWNVDKMDGTGISGITLTTDKCFILFIDLQFLGMGRVRVGFDIDGVVYIAHQFLNANILTVPYMQTATLPIQALLTSTATANTANMYFKCASVNSEGGIIDLVGYHFDTPEATATAANGTRTHIISLRPKTTFNGITNRMLVNLTHIDILNTGNNPVRWELVVGASFSVAPTYAEVNTTYSGTEYGSGGTFLNLTNGLVLDSGYIDSSAQNKGDVSRDLSSFYPASINRAGINTELGTYSVLVTGIGGASACRCVLGFDEVR